MGAELTDYAKSTASAALGLLAVGLQTAARAVERGAHGLRADEEAATAPPRTADMDDERSAGEATAPPSGDARAPTVDADSPAREPTVQASPAAPEPSGRAATVIAELADRPAREVIDEVGRLPTDDLRRLLEHERAGKQRKTVIDAIEQAVDAHQVR